MENKELITLKIGTIEGRHPLPVDDYFITEVENMFDFEEIDKKIENKWKEIRLKYPNNPIYVELYCTGLTYVTIATIEFLISINISYSTYHYDNQTNEYIEMEGMLNVRM